LKVRGVAQASSGRFGAISGSGCDVVVAVECARGLRDGEACLAGHLAQRRSPLLYQVRSFMGERGP
jgi:hypothetical protein